MQQQCRVKSLRVQGWVFFSVRIFLISMCFSIESGLLLMCA